MRIECGTGKGIVFGQRTSNSEIAPSTATRFKSVASAISPHRRHVPGPAQRIPVCLTFLNHRLCYVYLPENHPHASENKTRADKRPQREFFSANRPS